MWVDPNSLATLQTRWPSLDLIAKILQPCQSIHVYPSLRLYWGSNRFIFINVVNKPSDSTRHRLHVSNLNRDIYSRTLRARSEFWVKQVHGTQLWRLLVDRWHFLSISGPLKETLKSHKDSHRVFIQNTMTLPSYLVIMILVMLVYPSFPI